MINKWTCLWVFVILFGTSIATAFGVEGRYQWSSQATIAVGTRKLPVIYSGEVFASSKEEAEQRARNITTEKIKADYQSAAFLPDTLIVTVRTPQQDPIDEVRVRANLMCRYVAYKEEGLRIFSDEFVIISKPREINTFATKFRIQTPDGDHEENRQIRSVTRGSLFETVLRYDIWKGRLIDGGAPVRIKVSLKTKGEADADDIDMGAIDGTFAIVDGRLKCIWSPSRFATLVNVNESHLAKFKLQHDGRLFDLYIGASNPAEYAEQRRVEEAEFALKLANHRSDIKLVTGSLTYKYKNFQGQLLEMGVGRVFVISDNTEAAKKYIADNFPDRDYFIVCSNQKEAEDILRQAWQKQPHNEQIVDGSGSFVFAPKTQRQIIDQLGRPGRSRVPRRPR
jgi:hypothetical protein